jgi:aspartate aminotransferase
MRARDEGQRRWGSEFIDLSGSAPLVAWPSDEVVARALAVARPTRGYGAPEGTPAARAAAARYFSHSAGVPFGPENVLITTGALGGLFATLATVCHSAREVAVATPHYHAHPSLVELAGGRVVRVAGTKAGPMGHVELAGREPQALLFANPGNPTGITYGRRQVAGLAGGLPPGAAIIADEVYADYVYRPEEFTSVAQVLPADDTARWVVVRSASKTLGRPGLRIGVVLGPARFLEAIADRMAALTGAASLPAQAAFVAGLADITQVDHVRPYRRRLDLALTLCRQLGMTAEPPQGTYFLWLDGPGAGRLDTAVRLCTEAGVFVWPGAYFGAISHLRVSLAVPVRSLETGLRRIAANLTIEKAR